MVSLVLDASALIPCGRKSREEEEGVRRLGETLHDANATICVSQPMIKVYQQKVIPKLRACHPLPRFQSALYNAYISNMIGVVSKSRGMMCHERKLKGTRLWLHIYEKSSIERFALNEFALNEEDKDVLRTALCAAESKQTFLVTLDTHFLELDTAKLIQKHPNSEKLKIVTPDDPDLAATLTQTSKNRRPQK